jgi:hypothetical protein
MADPTIIRLGALSPEFTNTKKVWKAFLKNPNYVNCSQLELRRLNAKRDVL